MKIILSLQYNTIQVIIISLLAFSMPYIAAKETGALVNIKSSKNATKDIEKKYLSHLLLLDQPASTAIDTMLAEGYFCGITLEGLSYSKSDLPPQIECKKDFPSSSDCPILSVYLFIDDNSKIMSREEFVRNSDSIKIEWLKALCSPNFD